MRIVLRPPPKELSPNARGGHPAKKARPVREYRQHAWAEARRNGVPPHFLRARVQVTYYAATDRGRDGDNFLATMKPAFDGIADAGVVANDKQMVHEPVRFEIDRKYPRVEIEITPLPDRE